MKRDKSRDDQLFNCIQPYELSYVSGLYQERQLVHDFLVERCRDKTIYHSTHKQIYQLIQDRLGFPIPG